jgi:hypothetical protein
MAVGGWRGVEQIYLALRITTKMTWAGSTMQYSQYDLNSINEERRSVRWLLVVGEA